MERSATIDRPNERVNETKRIYECHRKVKRFHTTHCASAFQYNALLRILFAIRQRHKAMPWSTLSGKMDGNRNGWKKKM